MSKQAKRIRIFNRLVDKAKSVDLKVFMSENAERLNDVFSASEKLHEFKEDFLLVFEMLKAYAKGEYTEIPTRAISAIVGALLYVIMPLDAIPDFVLGFGLVDDAAVFGYALKLIALDLAKYSEWKSKQVENDQVVNAESQLRLTEDEVQRNSKH